ncbi:TIFY 5A-like [Musa troglodytarum]|uniref:Protein TIFY n=1 Tax=Musa troglodytarum TaxID=320322 RepID=A0A9E7GP97_9LILI|nr:TIFY 5A-like [Musa troglodytarum]
MVGSRCDPDLRLRLGINGGDDGGHCSTDFMGVHSSPDALCRVEEASGSSRSEYQQQQQLTICYNGRICVCDVTEIEAEAIIAMARQETDDQTRKKRREQQPKESSTTSSSSSPPPPPRQLMSPRFLQQLHVDPELSRKRSLQQFLQKRKLVEFTGKSTEYQQQQITMLYNRRICVFNLTDFKLLINPGLAMKRSLRLFLQKRKSRLHSLSPYAPRPL